MSDKPSLPPDLYTKDYFLHACEGYEEFAETQGRRLSRRLRGFGQTTLWPTLGKILVAAAAMGLGVAAALLGLDRLGLLPGFWRYALEVSGPGALGVAIYFAFVSRLNITEARVVVSLVQQKLGV